MNKLEIRTETRRLLAETTANSSYFSDTDINKFIDDGIKDMCIKAGVYQKTLSITVATATAAYKMPWDFLDVVSLRNADGVPLDGISPDAAGRVYVVTGYPLNFYITQAAASLATRANTTAYVTFPATCVTTLTYLLPATANGYFYECTTAGTSHSAPPTYGTTLAGTTSDGTVTWTCRELVTTLNTLNLVDTPTTAGGGTGTYSLIYKALDEQLAADTDSPNFPLQYHHNLVLYAAFSCFAKAKDVTLATAILTKYLTNLGLPVSTGGAESAS